MLLTIWAKVNYNKKMKYGWGLIIFLLISNILVWFIVQLETPSKYLKVSFLDVGQGDAILITAPNRNQVLIDGGPDRSVARALGKVIPFYDRTIDLVLETHPDADHIGGLPEVFSRYQVNGFIRPSYEASTNVYKKLQQSIKAEELAQLVAKEGTEINLGSDVSLEIIAAGVGKKSDVNSASLVTRLTYASTSFLFLGDAPIKIENSLVVKNGKKIKADVLKVSHHGGKSSNSFYFFKAVKPEYAVISVGAKNRYNHPSPETLAWLKQLGSEILQTKELGNINLKSDGVSVGF